MIGGVQRYTAVKQIVAENPDCGIETRRCAVYASDLSTAAQVVLARQHNEINQIQRVTTFSELAACCRRFAFQHLPHWMSFPRVSRKNTSSSKQAVSHISRAPKQ